MFGKKEKTFAMITAPLSGMVEELNDHVVKQEQKVVDLNTEKREIDQKINVAENEKAMSAVTAKNLKTFMDPTKVLVTKEAKKDDATKEAAPVDKDAKK